MFGGIINYLFGVGLQLVGQWGYWGLLLGMTLSSMMVPIPSAATLGFSGYLVFTENFDYSVAVLAASIGNLLGSTITYCLAKFLGRAVLLKYGKILGITEQKIAVSEAFIKKHGEWSIFISQLLPLIGAMISVPAGILKVPYIKFAVYTFSGGAIWCGVLIFAGKKLGENWVAIASKLTPFENAIKVVAVLLLLLFFIWRIRRYFQKAKSF